MFLYKHTKTIELFKSSFLYKGAIKAPKMQRDFFWFCVQTNRKLLYTKFW